MRIAGYLKHSLVDGPGIRYVLFAQGCLHDCPGCHNPDSHDPLGGAEYPEEMIISDIRKCLRKIDGVTLSGGDPFYQIGPCARIAREAKSMGLSVWAYTGFTYEEILLGKAGDASEFLSYIDVLVDGPYIEKLRTDKRPYRGSSNQRLIDVRTGKELSDDDVFMI